jgi:hypothetical protein
MSRKFEPDNLVQLPHLDALAAQTLGSAVLAAAAGKTLPGPVAEAVAEVKAAVDVLQTVAVERLPSADPVARAADINVDAAWGALSGLLGALTRLPDHPHAEMAATLRGQLFPDGLRFTRLPFRLEWAESANRLQMIDERGFAAQIEQLGGAVALAQVRQAHAHYGEVLAITAESADPSIGVREAWTAVMKALRLFVVRVTASVRPQDPQSAALASDLLAPIETWEHTAAAKPANDHAPTPAPTPTPPSPPAPVVTPSPVVTTAPATADQAASAGGAVAEAPHPAH